METNAVKLHFANVQRLGHHCSLFFSKPLRLLRHIPLCSSVLILREVRNSWPQPLWLMLSSFQKLLQPGCQLTSYISMIA